MYIVDLLEITFNQSNPLSSPYFLPLLRKDLDYPFYQTYRAVHVRIPNQIEKKNNFFLNGSNINVPYLATLTRLIFALINFRVD